MISTIEAETECVLVTTHATLRHRHDLLRFVASAQTLWTDLQAADGLIGYALHASMLSGTLTTVSAWKDRDTMLAFTRGPAHQRVVRQTRHLIIDSRVRSWITTGRQLSEQQDMRPRTDDARDHAAH